jgi:hypothetical protein
MGRPGYYITDVGDKQEFPIAERYGSDPIGIEEGDLELTTERGRRYIYKQFTRQTRRLVFRGTTAQLQFFKDLHQLLGGQETPFYFLPDNDDEATVLFVRKEKDFKPKELDQAAADSDGDTAVYDYELILTEEPSGPEVGL